MKNKSLLPRNNSEDQRHHLHNVGSSRNSQNIWRDEKILQMASEGYSQSDIAAALQLTQPTISKAISRITKTAYDNVRYHIESRLPFEREKTLVLFESIKKRAIDIANKKEGDIGERDRIAALTLAKDAGKEIMALHTQGEHVKNALNVAAGLQGKLSSLESIQQLLEEQQEEEGEGEELQLYK
jgi:DNA-binding MarR family transcriptional regulator